MNLLGIRQLANVALLCRIRSVELVLQ